MIITTVECRVKRSKEVVTDEGDKKRKKKKKRKSDRIEGHPSLDEDIVEDLVLSSDEEEFSDSARGADSGKDGHVLTKQPGKKRKVSKRKPKDRQGSGEKKSKKHKHK